MSRYKSYAKFGSGVCPIAQSSGMDSESSSRRRTLFCPWAQYFCPRLFIDLWSQASTVSIPRPSRVVRDELARIVYFRIAGICPAHCFCGRAHDPWLVAQFGSLFSYLWFAWCGCLHSIGYHWFFCPHVFLVCPYGIFKNRGV